MSSMWFTPGTVIAGVFFPASGSHDYTRVDAAAEKQSKMLSALRRLLLTLNSQPKPFNRPLCWCAAKSAWQRRGDVGSDHLLGRFVGSWFFSG